MLIGLTSHVGNVGVQATVGRGHTPEAIAEMCLGRILHVSKDSPEAIRLQAEAYKDQILGVLVHYMKMAAQSDRTTLYNELNRQGHADLAEMIRRL